MKKYILSVLVVMVVLSLAGCGMEKRETGQDGQNVKNTEASATEQAVTGIAPTDKIAELEKGLSVVRYDGDYAFDKFLSRGGASSDEELIGFLSENLLSGMDLGFLGNIFGCSTIAVKDDNGAAFFGRNFDWEHCEALVVLSHPESRYRVLQSIHLLCLMGKTFLL